MQLAHIAWPDVERYLASSDVALIPIGSTEQHGPNGLCGTDHLTAEGHPRRKQILAVMTMSLVLVVAGGSSLNLALASCNCHWRMKFPYN